MRAIILSHLLTSISVTCSALLVTNSLISDLLGYFYTRIIINAFTTQITVPWPASGWTPWVHLHCPSFRRCRLRSSLSSWPWCLQSGHGSCLRYFSREWSATSTWNWTWRSCRGYGTQCVWWRSYDDDPASGGWLPSSTSTSTSTWHSCRGYATWCVLWRSYDDDSPSPGGTHHWLLKTPVLQSRTQMLPSW